MNVTLVILAAGLSRRYGRLKQLEPVGPNDEAIMDYAMYDAMRAGYERVVVVTRREIAGAMRLHIDARFKGALDVDFAWQEIDALPRGFTAPPNREKPWGSGHAVLAAGKSVSGPFVVANADDFYGALPYAMLGERLLSTAGSPAPVFALAGYRLETTLSEHGGVSRAVCATDARGRLQHITEVFDVKWEGDIITGRTPERARVRLLPDTFVSMNLWAFTPAVFAALEAQFAAFLAAHTGDSDAEFLISTAIDEQVWTGTEVHVVPANGVWLGVTFSEDRPRVAARLREFIAAGDYPSDLKAEVRRLAG